MTELIKTDLGTLNAVGIGLQRAGQVGSHTATATVVGSGSVSATVLIKGSNDGLSWTTLSTITASGTGTGTGTGKWTDDYALIRQEVSSLTGVSVSTQVVTDQSGGGATSQALGAGGGTGDKLLPLVDASKGYVTKCAKVENIPSSATQTLIDTTSVGKPGVVSCIYLVTDTLAFFRDGVLRVYVDGESTPSIDIEMHNFGTYGLQSNNSYWTTRQQVQSADPTAGNTGVPQAQCIVFKYPIPYKTGIKIQIVPRPGETSRLFSNVIYHEGLSLPWKLKCSTVGYANRLTGLDKTKFETRQIKILDRPAGQSGVIAGLSLTFPTFGTSLLENNPVVYSATQPLDGTADPLFNTSGMEDFFGDFYYFANLRNGNSPWKFIVTVDGLDPTTPSTFTRLAIFQDFLDHHGGISYTDGAVLTFEKGKAANPGDQGSFVAEMFYAVWYYEPA